MADISAKVVMDLRNETGLSMMECKKALVEANGDKERAIDILRKAMKGKMDAKTDKAAGEGRIAIAIDGAKGASMIELKANTDFTAKNETFVKLADSIAQDALKAPVGKFAAPAALSAKIDELRAQTGETIQLGRAEHIAGGAGVKFGSYVHHDGKTGALIKAEGAIADDALRQICMHIVAATPRPQGVSASDIPPAAVERERKFRLEQALESGKPQQIAEKMVEGGMKKFYEDVALLEQPYVVDPTKKVKDIVGSGAKVIAFWRWAVGEQA